MRFEKQHKTIDVKNIESSLGKSTKLRHSSLLPCSIRALIVGPSNCGKTNIMISLIESPNGLKFKNIYLYSKSLYQPKYEYLKQLIEPINGMKLMTFSNNDEVISPDDAERNSIFIFDDIACENQNHVRSYFCMGRHKDVDSFYLCQTYTRIPKHLIRDNANMIIMFKQDEMNIKHIFNDHVGSDMSFKSFYEMCCHCWKDQYGFLVISKDDNIEKGRYRKGFNEFIVYN